MEHIETPRRPTEGTRASSQADPRVEALRCIGRSTASPSKAKTAIEKQVKRGWATPTPLPVTLRASDIVVVEKVFQHRDPSKHQSRWHIRQLARTPKDGRMLAPILVWWAGTGWVVVDGHHRLEAYRAADWGSEEIAVSCLTGTLEEALLEGAKANCRPTLQMDKSERLNAAWRLTLLAGGSKAQLAEAAGVATSTIGGMRKVAGMLRKDDSEEDLSELSWKRALGLARGATPDDANFEEEQAKEAREMANTLLGTFGRLSYRKKETLAMALSIYDCQLVREVVNQLNIAELEEVAEQRRADIAEDRREDI
ncbi:MAG: ParB/Srx family N-terminal domain-containing protein [Pseudomonadota bacterium]